MQRSFNERINSHWVRGCFGEDWQESFRQRDLAKDQALTGVWGHPVVQYQPLRNEWDVANASRLRQKFVWDSELDLEMGREAVARADSRRGVKPKFKTPYYTNLNWDRIRSALRKYSTITLERAIQKYSTPGPKYIHHYRPPAPKPKAKRREKRLAPVTRPKVEISPYAPLEDHLDFYIKKEVKEKKLPQPEVVTATKALIEKRVEEFKSQAKTMADLEDAKLWRLKMHNALEALLKNGRVHEFIN